MNRAKNNKLGLMIILMFIIAILAMTSVGDKSILSKENFKVGQHIYVQMDETKKANLVSIGGDIYINGEIEGNALSIGGNIYVNGKVSKNVTALFGEIVRGENSEIFGKERQIFKSPKITEKFKNVNINNKVKMNYKFIWSFVFLSICCSIVYYFMSININFMMNYLVKENIFRGVMYGYLALFSLITIIFILILSILGVVLVPFVALVLFLFFIVGFATIAIFLGQEFYKRFRIGHSPYTRIAIGVGILQVIRSIAIFNIGNILWKLVIIPLSIGIIFVKKFRIFR
ncbi:hypothetical protein [Clostridium tetani]|uniref:Polymer-forming cytoskeletal protein n=1 Tax=Clostridium tetani TaxID=1513 RepID=A0ABY0ERM0_CLOTA|nr:hypothetical protein [Clostridium tetani]CDI50641.1 hypothetical protein BN906_02677 [Clostridium tetani 12124569]KHO32167.1 hypothetical protein OR62_12725 [Clostridium tetani]RXI39686.1 hypothetical protein DP129_05665 [Clostridium tetani]RXI57837.1 hypothetical protein DP131_04190 [Clostridium tetani]RXI67765.1 hypothetical protein DQN76_11260 [Clostridium tetani]